MVKVKSPIIKLVKWNINDNKNMINNMLDDKTNLPKFLLLKKIYE